MQVPGQNHLLIPQASIHNVLLSARALSMPAIVWALITPGGTL